MKKVFTIVAAIALLCLGVVAQAAVTGNPLLDSWASCGNSLSNGVYVRNSANYGFDTYTARLIVSSGSSLEISDGPNSWLAGDTVMGVGGRFAGITASAAGWPAFTGNNVNSILGEDTKFVAKFGASDATFAASTNAPAGGNGLGSFGTNGGNGAVQIRTTGWFYAADWAAGSGALQLLNKPEHIERNSAPVPDTDVARLIWVWNPSGHVDSWEILLNTSLLGRLDPTFSGLGNLGIAAVQRRESAYTDALVTIPAAIPEPSSIIALISGLGSLLAFKRRKA